MGFEKVENDNICLHFDLTENRNFSCVKFLASDTTFKEDHCKCIVSLNNRIAV